MTTLFDSDQLRSISKYLETVNELFERSVSGSTMIQFPETIEIADVDGNYMGSIIFEEDIFVFAPDYDKPDLTSDP